MIEKVKGHLWLFALTLGWLAESGLKTSGHVGTEEIRMFLGESPECASK